MAISIRPYREADLDPLTSLWLDSWKSTGIPASGTGLLVELRTRMVEEIAGGWSVHVASLGAEIVGFLALKDDLLDQLFIAPAWQNQGLGKQLLDFVKQERSKGFWLTTAAESRAPRFYDREGLVRGETSPHPRFGHPMVRYVWPAPP
jgi:GNAT superfamily N-acetyltransferase